MVQVAVAAVTSGASRRLRAVTSAQSEMESPTEVAMEAEIRRSQ